MTHSDAKPCVGGGERARIHLEHALELEQRMRIVALNVVRFPDPVLRARYQTVLRILRDEIHELEHRLAVLARTKRFQRRGERLLRRLLAWHCLAPR